jgi:hypothetical protein
MPRGCPDGLAAAKALRSGFGMPLSLRTTWLRVQSARLGRALQRLAERTTRAHPKLTIGVSLLVVMLVGAAAAVKPVLIGRAKAAAARAGVDVSIQRASLGWGRVRFGDVVAKAPEVPGASLRLDLVDVGVGLNLRVKSISVHGGEITLRAPMSELEQQFRNWKQRRKGGGGSGGSVSYAVDGLAVDWRSPGRGLSALRLWGLRAGSSKGSSSIAADLTRAAWRGGTADLWNLRARLQRQGEGRALERLSTDRVVAQIELDAPAPGFPIAPPASGTSGSGNGNGRKTRGSRAAPAPDDSHFGPDLQSKFARVAQLRMELTQFGRVAEAALSQRGEVELSGVSLRLKRGGETLNIGPVRFGASRDASRVRFSLTPGAQAAKPLTLALEVPFAAGEVKLQLDGGPVSLASLGIHEGDWGLRQVSRGEIDGKSTLILSADGQTLRAKGQGRIRELSIQHRALSARPISGLELGFHGGGEVALDGQRLQLDRTELQFGKVRLALEGDLEQSPAHTRVRLLANLPLAACQDVLESVPEGLAPLLSGMRMSGTVGFDGTLEFDTRKLDDMRAQWHAQNDCRIVATPGELAPARFARPWIRTVSAADGRLVSLESGPGTSSWTPYHAISSNMETAVLICEDGGFFRHHGFDHEAIRNSIRENIRTNRFVRGASTISMQLAKNLYLGREKTLGRKLQEMVFTLLLEQELSKEELMELYLNVIEFAPGVYGVGPAAQYYFNTTAGRLSLGQALYLASILPNPKQQHFAPDGEVSTGWMNYLRKLMYIGHKRRRISEQELADGLLEQVTFGVPYSPRSITDESASFHDEAVLDTPGLEQAPPLHD